MENCRPSTLSPAEYGKRREALSEELEIGLGWLDKEYDYMLEQKRRAGEERPQFLMSPEPWPEPVDGSELLLGLVIIVRRHVVMSASAALATALWVIHTHSMECSSISPILAIESPEKRCGKTTLSVSSGTWYARR